MGSKVASVVTQVLGFRGALGMRKVLFSHFRDLALGAGVIPVFLGSEQGLLVASALLGHSLQAPSIASPGMNAPDTEHGMGEIHPDLAVCTFPVDFCSC